MSKEAQAEPNAQVAAVKTLKGLGYTYHGAELWKPPIGEPLTTTYIQEVPDKCDRIIWKGSYLHLPNFSSIPEGQESVAWGTVFNAVSDAIIKCKDVTGQHRNINKFVNAVQITNDSLRTGTSPPQRKPLTVHEIGEFVGTHGFDTDQLLWFRLGEAAHGIKGDA